MDATLVTMVDKHGNSALSTHNRQRIMYRLLDHNRVKQCLLSAENIVKKQEIIMNRLRKLIAQKK